LRTRHDPSPRWGPAVRSGDIAQRTAGGPARGLRRRPACAPGWVAAGRRHRQPARTPAVVRPRAHLKRRWKYSQPNTRLVESRP
jgi:hypothetical protein